ncbi:hypothetical protein ABK040_002723 [Willaertia magna]
MLNNNNNSENDSNNNNNKRKLKEKGMKRKKNEEEEEENTEMITQEEEDEQQQQGFFDNNYIDIDENPEQLDIDFDVTVPDFDTDYYGVETYIRNYLRGSEYNYVEFTDLILGDAESKIVNPYTSVIKAVSQNVGDMGDDENGSSLKPNLVATSVQKGNNNTTGVMKDDDEVDPSEWNWSLDMYGVISLLDMKEFKKKQSIKQIKSYILQKCIDKEKYNQINEIFDSSRVGLIVNERVINLPIEVGGMLHINLFEEIQREQDENNHPAFDYFLILTKVYHVKNDLAGVVKKVKDEIIFYKPEEEFYLERAHLSFDFPIKSEYTEDSSSLTLSDENTFQKGVCMLVKSKKMKHVLKKIKKELVPESTKVTRDE